MTKKELLGIQIQKPDAAVFLQAKQNWETLAKPIDGLGDLEEMICRIALIRGTVEPNRKKALLIFCADNGVVEEGVTQTDKSVTAQVAALMGARKSSVGIMLKDYPADILAVDIGIDSAKQIPGILHAKVRRGTGNIALEPAMTTEECLRAIETGIGLMQDLKEKGYGIVATGEMGIGNTTTSTAVLCALTGEDAGKVTGRGAGLSDAGLQKKIAVIKQALQLHGLDKQAALTGEYALHVLTCVGGLDLAGLTGAFIGGALCHIPVVIDGLISAVAAYLAQLIVPGCADYMIASHNGREQGCALVLQKLGLRAILHANLALGEGSGAVLLFPLLDMAESLYRCGTRFSDTAIPAYERQPS